MSLRDDRETVKKIYLILIFAVLLISFPLAGFAFEQGLASWYGGKFHGRITASGEIFDTNKLTAAHKTLPFGSIVKVTNLDNGKYVIVRINDRGPFVKGRIIDLSRAAAEAIDLVGKGVARVRLEVLSLGNSEKVYKIQVAAYREIENAEKLKAMLEKGEIQAIFEYGENNIVRVVIENVLQNQLDWTIARLKKLGIDDPLVRLEIKK